MSFFNMVWPVLLSTVRPLKMWVVAQLYCVNMFCGGGVCVCLGALRVCKSPSSIACGTPVSEDRRTTQDARKLDRRPNRLLQ